LRSTKLVPVMLEAFIASLNAAVTAVAVLMAVEFGAGVLAVIVGAVVSVLLATVTEIAEVAVLPAASRATAVSEWLALEAVVEFQETEYGLVVSSAPRFAPSSLNWTPATPTLSPALAETVTAVPETVAPLAGAVIETVGSVVSLDGVLNVKSPEVAGFPAESVLAT